MSVTLRFQGLEELKADLRALPADLTVEAGHVVQGVGNAAAVAIRTVYAQHQRSGNLVDHLTVDHQQASRFGVVTRIKSGARHAWLFDYGSQARHYVTKAGKTHATGAMWGKTPPTHIFMRTLVAARREMYAKLAGVLEAHGLRARQG